MRSLVAPLLVVLAGCSASNFEVSETPDAMPEETAVEETSADTGSVADSSAPPDTEAVVDSGTPDTAPPPDDCVPNACKGCSKLANEPGAPCGTCGAGAYACDGTDAVKCAEVHTKKPGDACGTCDGGKYACKATALACEDPFTGPKPGDACGACNAGKFACSGVGVATCTDPFTGPAPASACGTCGTLKRTCATDGKSATCPGNDANPCGGCTALANPPGKVCGVCAGGAFVCSGKEATTCSDPVATPAPGTVCGTCSTSSFACSGTMATSCTKPDDRKVGSDAFYSTLTTTAFTLTSVVPLGIGFTTTRIGAISSVTIGLIGHVDDAAAAPGSVRMRLIRGAANAASFTVLDTATVNAATIPGDTPSPVTFTFATTPTLAASEKMFLEISDDSPGYNFSVMGGGPTGPAHLSFWTRASPAGLWNEYTAVDPYLTVTSNGCGF